MADKSQQVVQLEQAVYDVAKLTVGIAEVSYRINRIAGGISQIDGYFRHGPDRYRVECKWEQNPITRDDIDLFVKKLDAAGVGGVFVSMSGFSESAVQGASEIRKERTILLTDGDEARAVFEGRINFDEVITRKRIYFDQYSESYHRVLPHRVSSELSITAVENRSSRQ